MGFGAILKLQTQFCQFYDLLPLPLILAYYLGFMIKHNPKTNLYPLTVLRTI